jgi:hypothetical protein
MDCYINLLSIQFFNETLIYAASQKISSSYAFYDQFRNMKWSPQLPLPNCLNMQPINMATRMSWEKG